jgi:hypothetical protein
MTGVSFAVYLFAAYLFTGYVFAVYAVRALGVHKRRCVETMASGGALVTG